MHAVEAQSAQVDNTRRVDETAFVDRSGELRLLPALEDDPTMVVTLEANRFRRLPRKENWLTVLKACPVTPDAGNCELIA